jgi:hypothetical protein
MTTLAQRGLAMAARTMGRAAGGDVTYARAEREVWIEEAVFGRTEFQVETDNGVMLETSDRDFIFPAEKLILDGERATPLRGDLITVAEPIRDSKEVFEVLAPGGAQPYRYADPYGVLIRVHTKKRP